MPVVDAKRAWSTRGLRISRDGREFVDLWQVQIVQEDGVDPRQMIYDSGQVPVRGQAHDTVVGVFCTDVDVSPDGGPNSWAVSATFETPSVDEGLTNPQLAPPEIEIYGETYEEPIDIDLDGNAITTTAGEPFDPPLVRKVTDLVINYRFNVLVAFLNVPWLFTFKDKVNSTAVNGLGDAGQVLVDGAPSATLVRSDEEGIPDYWRCELKLKIREPYEDANAPEKSAWFDRRLNAGYRYIDPDDDDKLKTVTDDDGLPLNQKVLLDENGHRTDTPHAVFFRIYAEADLNALALQIPGITG